MAQKIIHQLVDDLDGAELDPADGETVQFGLDGKAYEIDLSNAHAATLREALARYIRAGRRTSVPRSRNTARRAPVRDLEAVRSWARANGHTVADRGRVPEAILHAFDAAH